MSFTSGKGGVGKTVTVLNTAISLTRLGKSVLVLDADLGLANVDVMLGLQPRATLQHVLDGSKKLEEIMLEGPEGVSIIPAASGIEGISNLDSQQRLMLMEAVEEVAHRYDYLLIDTAAGIGADVMYFNSASSEVVCVINPQPTSLTDTYAMIKILSRNYGEKSVSVIANNVRNESEARGCFDKLARVVDKFLHVELRYIGHIPTDSLIVESIQEQVPMVQRYPSSHAGLAYAAIARRIDHDFRDRVVKGGMQFFFRQLLEAGVNGI
jgi:flagellar biosynthesis protein FlhG